MLWDSCFSRHRYPTRIRSVAVAGIMYFFMVYFSVCLLHIAGGDMRKKKKGLKMVLNSGGEPVLVGFKDWFLVRGFSEGVSSADEEFFEKRRAGARKISASAKEKGGPAMLTHWHFLAKDAEYEDVFKALEDRKGKEFFVGKYKSFLEQLHKSDFEQKRFQTISGQMEVWGEALSRLFHGDSEK